VGQVARLGLSPPSWHDCGVGGGVGAGVVVVIGAGVGASVVATGESVASPIGL